MNKKLLVVVPCGYAKIWDKNPDQGPTEAGNAYTSSLFKVNRKFAEKFGDKWIILSAKYGFVSPDFVIPKDYDVTFKDPSADPIGSEALREQVLTNKIIQESDVVIALGGKDYSERVKEAFDGITNVVVPAEGLNLFKAIHEISSLSKLSKIEMLKRIGMFE